MLFLSICLLLSIDLLHLVLDHLNALLFLTELITLCDVCHRVLFLQFSPVNILILHDAGVKLCAQLSKRLLILLTFGLKIRILGLELLSGLFNGLSLFRNTLRLFGIIRRS